MKISYYICIELRKYSIYLQRVQKGTPRQIYEKGM